MHVLSVLSVSSFAIIPQRKRELVALLWLCSCCRLAVSVMCLFIVDPLVGLCSGIVAFPGHTHLLYVPGSVLQSVASQIVDPGVASSIPAQPHTSVEIEHVIFSTVILLLPLIQVGLFSVTNKSMCTKYCTC